MEDNVIHHGPDLTCPLPLPLWCAVLSQVPYHTGTYTSPTSLIKDSPSEHLAHEKKREERRYRCYDIIYNECLDWRKSLLYSGRNPLSIMTL